MIGAADRILSRVRLRQLSLFAEAARLGSIVAAARALNLSQPAATKMVQDLERDIGATLFERTNRGVVPTAYGETLLRHATLIFATVGAAAQEIEDLAQGRGGRVAVGTLLAASSRVLPRAIARLRADTPGVAVSVVGGTNAILMPALRRGEIDLVVGRLPVHRHRGDLAQEVLYAEAIVAVTRAGHPLAADPDPTLDRLAAFDWILPPPETTLRRQIDQLFAGRGLSPPRQVIDSVDYLTNRALVTETDMVWIVPRLVVAADVATGTLAALPWTAPFGAGPVGITTRDGDALSPAARRLVRHLRAVAAAL